MRVHCAMPNRGRSRKVFVRAIACTFLLYHLAALTLTNLSTSTTLRNSLHVWVRPYTGVLGLWQEWDMFTTIPYYSEVRPSLSVQFLDKGPLQLGPMLPALTPAPESLRISTLFSRIMWSRRSFEDNVSRWERMTCRAIQASTGQRPKSFQLKLATERLNTLAQVRATGKIAHPEEFSTKPALCKP